uniref:response regulator n=1 Tax=uncultured Sphingomonas sp. TaxID=158754 RepID=UPI0035C992A0
MATTKILILDDNPVVLRTIATLARELDFWVAEATSIEAACNYLNAGTIDVLLCDDDLGSGLSGIDFILGELVKMPQTIVLMSGRPRPPELPETIRYLAKPFTILQLQMAVAPMCTL